MVVRGQQGLGLQGSPLRWALHGPWARTSRSQPQAGRPMPCRHFTSGDVHCAHTGPGLDAGGLRMSGTRSLRSSSLRPSGRRRPRTCKLIKEQNGQQRWRVLRGGGRCGRGVGRGKRAGAGRGRRVRGGPRGSGLDAMGHGESSKAFEHGSNTSRMKLHRLNGAR